MVTLGKHGFSVKESQRILDLKSPTKVSQAMNPAWEKVAKHWLADPKRTLLTLLMYADELTPMPDVEIEARRAMAMGRFPG